MFVFHPLTVYNDLYLYIQSMVSLVQAKLLQYKLD